MFRKWIKSKCLVETRCILKKKKKVQHWIVFKRLWECESLNISLWIFLSHTLFFICIYSKAPTLHKMSWWYPKPIFTIWSRKSKHSGWEVATYELFDNASYTNVICLVPLEKRIYKLKRTEITQFWCHWNCCWLLYRNFNILLYRNFNISTNQAHSHQWESSFTVPIHVQTHPTIPPPT